MPRKNKGICVRSDEQVIQQFKQFLSQGKFSNYGQGLKYLLENVGSEVFGDYVDCQFFGEYPLDSKHFIQCRNSGTIKVPRKREDCEKCHQHKKVRVLMQRKEKIEQEIVKSEHRLGNLRTEINEETKQLKNIENWTNMPEQLKDKDKEIAGLQRNLEDRLKEKDAEIRELQEGMNALENDCLKSSMEPYDKIHSEQNTSIVERITKKEEITEKFQQPQQTQTRPSQLVLCPKARETVSFEDVCKKTCQSFMECPNYAETVMLNKALGKQ